MTMLVSDGFSVYLLLSYFLYRCIHRFAFAKNILREFPEIGNGIRGVRVGGGGIDGLGQRHHR